jgi:hypothetical protein
MPVSKTQFREILEDTPLSEEEAEALEEQKRVYDEVLSQKNLAKYKIELMVGKEWAPSKPCPGALSFWESGSKFHGGGDTIMHICPEGVKNPRSGRPGCGAFLPDLSHDYGFLVCPKCHSVWDGEEVWGQIFCRLNAAGWAQVVLKWFLRLEMDSDITMKYHPDDIRSAAMREQEKQRMGEDLGRVRRRRAIRIYPLARIIKDVNAGADLAERIRAFIRA